jgi:hypothetical protein
MKQAVKPLRRQVFVLTPDEKRAAACVIGAFLLGLATMHYRAKHPRTPPAPTAKEQRDAKRSGSRPPASQSTPEPRAAATAVEPNAPGAEESDDDQ